MWFFFAYYILYIIYCVDSDNLFSKYYVNHLHKMQFFLHIILCIYYILLSMVRTHLVNIMKIVTQKMFFFVAHYNILYIFIIANSYKLLLNIM